MSRNGDGLLVAFSQNTLIENVEATYNFWGISLMVSSQTTVKNCNLSDNSQGAFMYYSDNVKIEENRISHNKAGISLLVSNNNEICHNDFVSNSPYHQARFHMSANNHIYDNNFIGDTRQALIDTQGYANSWDDGYPSGGNYWSDHITVDDYSGVNQDIPGSDGIVDEPYIIDDDNCDNYPLVEPWSPLPRTIGELKAEIEECWLEGEIDNQGIVRSLIAKLDVAQKLVDKRKIDEAKTILEEVFIPQVENLTRIHLTVEAADILIKSAEYIISHL